MNILLTQCVKILPIISCLLIGSRAFAFGDQGHQVIAAIAYERLTPITKAKVDSLLAADTDPLTKTDFISRAVWADKFRDSDRNSSHKTHYNQTHNWHFVDLDIQSPNMDEACNHHPMIASGQLASTAEAQDCVIDKINQFKIELASANTPQSEKIVALKFLIHFIGDLHQPLHAAENKHDAGGNGVPVAYTKASTGKINHTTLHGYWDHEAVESNGKDIVELSKKLRKGISKKEAALWIQGSTTEWALESFDLAKRYAYHLDEMKTYQSKSTTGYILDDIYAKSAQKIAAEQLQKAGVRLAFILNASLDNGYKIN